MADLCQSLKSWFSIGNIDASSCGKHLKSALQQIKMHFTVTLFLMEVVVVNDGIISGEGR